MNVHAPSSPQTSELTDERVPARAASHPPRGFAERMVTGLLDKMPRGGLRMERSDGIVRHFGAPGAPVTARIRIHDDAEFFKRCAFYGNIGMGEVARADPGDAESGPASLLWTLQEQITHMRGALQALAKGKGKGMPAGFAGKGAGG